MAYKSSIGLAAAIVIAAGMMMAPARAAPMGAAAADVHAVSRGVSHVDAVHWRRCWWRHGHRHCHWFGGADYFYAVPYVGFSIWGGRHFHHHHRR